MFITFTQVSFQSVPYFTKFDVNSKAAENDEEFIHSSGYDFHLDLDVLLDNSETTRSAERNKRRGITKIPRPQNAWIIYRRNKCAGLKMDPERKNQKSKDLSRDIARMWVNEPKEVKELFEALSRISERKHNEKFGDYKYKPNRSESKKSKLKLRKSKSKTSNSEPKLPKPSELPKLPEPKPSELPKLPEPKSLEPPKSPEPKSPENGFEYSPSSPSSSSSPSSPLIKLEPLDTRISDIFKLLHPIQIH